MTSDPSINIVVFAVTLNGKLERLVGESKARAPHCVQSVWEKLKKQHDLTERNVSEVYSEWEPSATDVAFIEQHFPDIKVAFSFSRPANDTDSAWEDALATAKKTTEQANAKKLMQDAMKEKKTFTPLPVLRNADGFAEMVVNIPLIPEVALFLAHVGLTSRGTIGIDYVMLNKVASDGLDVGLLWEHAFTNLAKGLSIQAAEQRGARYFVVEHATGVAAAAVGLPGFLENAEAWAGSKQLTIGILNPSMLMVCASASRAVQYVRDMALKSPYNAAVNLTPCVLQLNEGKLSLLARAKSG